MLRPSYTPHPVCTPPVPGVCKGGPRMKEQRPHLCHLDHVGELGEAGDGDDIVVCPALGPGRRKPTVKG